MENLKEKEWFKKAFIFVSSKEETKKQQKTQTT